jgi:putative membrane protein
VSSLYKQAFVAAVAVAAVVALAGSPAAQDMKKDKAGLQGQDAKYMREIAQANMAEVQAGKLGASKASSDEVKKFAQHMVDDHGKQLAEVRSMAKAKGMKLPNTPAKKHQDAMKKLASASGGEFDKAFMQQMVKDHEDALKLVQATSKNAKDKELKAAARKATPAIQEHLEMAKSISASLK